MNIIEKLKWVYKQLTEAHNILIYIFSCQSGEKNQQRKGVELVVTSQGVLLICSCDSGFLPELAQVRDAKTLEMWWVQRYLLEAELLWGAHHLETWGLPNRGKLESCTVRNNEKCYWMGCLWCFRQIKHSICWNEHEGLATRVSFFRSTYWVSAPVFSLLAQESTVICGEVQST